MNDLISKKALIEQIRLTNNRIQLGEKVTGFNLTGIEVVELINNAPLAKDWIPINSGILPEINKDVQITFREFMQWNNKYRYGICKAIYISKHSITSEDMGWNDCEDVEEYDEFEDTFYIKSGWYEVIENWDDYTHVYINCEVIAWMPLPEKYKDDNNE